MTSIAARVIGRRRGLPGSSWIRPALRTCVCIACCCLLATEAPAQSTDDSTTSTTSTGPSGEERRSALETPVKPGEPRDLSFDDLKFDIEKGADYKPSMLTEAIKGLDGQTVRIRGFVRPGFKQSGIKNFILVRDNQECCFGPGAALYDCVMVKMDEGQTIDFTVRPITVVGAMQLKEFVGKDKKVWAIFRMNEARME